MTLETYFYYNSLRFLVHKTAVDVSELNQEILSLAVIIAVIEQKQENNNFIIEVHIIPLEKDELVFVWRCGAVVRTLFMASFPANSNKLEWAQNSS